MPLHSNETSSCLIFHNLSFPLHRSWKSLSCFCLPVSLGRPFLAWFQGGWEEKGDARVPPDWAGTASTENASKAFTPLCLPAALTYKLPAFPSLDASQSSPAFLHSHPPFRIWGSVTYHRGFRKDRGVQWRPHNQRIHGKGVKREISIASIKRKG